ncbi:MAG: chromosomal replication initiator protein DnaA [Pseudomonadota bacterium]
MNERSKVESSVTPTLGRTTRKGRLASEIQVTKDCQASANSDNSDEIHAGGKSVSSSDIFTKVCKQLRASLGTEVYQSWFGRLKLVNESETSVTLSVPTSFLKNWINSHYLETITELWQKEVPSISSVKIVLRSAIRADAPGFRDEQTAVKRSSLSNSQKAANAQTPFFNASAPGTKANSGRRDGAKGGFVLGSPIDSRFTFDTFVEGPSNRVCLAAARAAADRGPNAARFNPLFFHSNVGLGKTHLLQALANAAKANDPKKRVVYLTAEYFMWRFASAIRDQDALTLKENLHEIDTLIIDDMQFLQGEKIQSEFCHLINALLDSARQVIVAANRPPSELESLDERVRSRLQSGVSLEIEAPDYEMRLSMLRQRLIDAKQDDPSIEITDDVLQHVAKTVNSSFRELEGAFNQLVFRHSFEPDLSLDRVDDILGHLVKVDERKKVRIEDIQRVVAQHYNIPKNEMLSNRRTRTVVRPRQIAMYLSKVMTLRSLPEIGRRFGGRDHTTILHAVRKVEELKGGDAKLAKEIELLRRLIEE